MWGDLDEYMRDLNSNFIKELELKLNAALRFDIGAVEEEGPIALLHLFSTLTVCLPLFFLTLQIYP